MAAVLAASCGRIGREIYTLMKTEFGEVEEPVPPGTVGNSTMPAKAQPQAVSRHHRRRDGNPRVGAVEDRT